MDNHCESVVWQLERELGIPLWVSGSMYVLGVVLLLQNWACFLFVYRPKIVFILSQLYYLGLLPNLRFS